MFLRYSTRTKNGKEHRYWSIVENKRCAGDKIVQRHVLYLGEINDREEAAWQKSIEVFEEGQPLPRTVALFPAERALEAEGAEDIVRVKLGGSCSCADRGSGVPVGWPVCFTRNWGSTASGPGGCRPTAKARAGI